MANELGIKPRLLRKWRYERVVPYEKIHNVILFDPIAVVAAFKNFRKARSQVNADESPPGSEMENPRQRTEGKSKVFHSINNALAVGTQASSRCRDPWLALYLLNLRTLNAQFGGGPVSDHFVGTATGRKGG